MADTGDRHEKPLERLRAEYEGPPPVPPEVVRERIRAELGVEVTAYHAEYVYFEDGEARVIPTTVVEFPDGSTTQFFPESPPRRQSRPQ